MAKARVGSVWFHNDGSELGICDSTEVDRVGIVLFLSGGLGRQCVVPWWCLDGRLPGSMADWWWQLQLRRSREHLDPALRSSS
jgi:hypothetical protein